MIGRTLSGIYRVSEHVAGGGFADFFLGRDLRTNTIVGLKILRARLAGQPDAARRFFGEAYAAQSLDSPHVVRVLDHGEDAGTLYIVMEYVEGHTLAGLLAREGTIEPDVAVGLTRQILRGLETAHRAGIIHGDVKPQNVIVTPDGTAKIADFGVARIVGDDTSSETSPDESTTDGRLIGTASYVSPEQAIGRVTDVRSDLYSVAAVLFEMLAGRPPFVADEPSRILEMHATTAAPRLSQFCNDLPVGLVEAVARGLEKSPDRRYESAATFREALGFWEQSTRTLRAIGETGILRADERAGQPQIEKQAAFSQRDSGRAPEFGLVPRSGDRDASPGAQDRRERPVAPRSRRPGRLSLSSLARVAVAIAVVAVAGLVMTHAEAMGQLAAALLGTVETSGSGIGTVVAQAGDRASSARESVGTVVTEMASEAETTATARADETATTVRARPVTTAQAEDDSAATGATSGVAAPTLRTKTPVHPSATPASRSTATATPTRATPPTATAARAAAPTPRATTTVAADSRAATTPIITAPAKPTAPSVTTTTTPTPTLVTRPTATPASTATPITLPTPSPAISTAIATTSTRQVVREYPERTANDPSEICEIRQWSDGVFERLRCRRDATPMVAERQIVREYPERTDGNPAEVCLIRQWSDGSYERLECKTDPASAGSADVATPQVVQEYPERTAGRPAEVCVIQQWSDGRYVRTDCRIGP